MISKNHKEYKKINATGFSALKEKQQSKRRDEEMAECPLCLEVSLIEGRQRGAMDSGFGEPCMWC